MKMQTLFNLLKVSVHVFVHLKSYLHLMDILNHTSKTFGYYSLQYLEDKKCFNEEVTRRLKKLGIADVSNEIYLNLVFNILNTCYRVTG